MQLNLIPGVVLKIFNQNVKGTDQSEETLGMVIEQEKKGLGIAGGLGAALPTNMQGF